MSRAVLKTALGMAVFVAASSGTLAGAAPIPFPLPLPYLNDAVEILPFGGQALGVDGKNVVGRSGTVGFLYDGKNSTVIRPPGGADAAATGISGINIVGWVGTRGFLYDGADYVTFSAPWAATGRTVPQSISGNSIVGWYYDGPYTGSNIPHGFLYDGTTWTPLEHPLGARGTIPHGIDGNNIVGSYITSLGRIRGFLFDGTTWTTLNHPGNTIAHDIEGSTIVGYTSFPSTSPIIYDGTTFDHPTLGAPNAVFTGISGNKMVGYYRDGPSGFDVPFIYTVPEPGSLTLGAMGGLIVLAVARRARRKPSL